MKNSKFSVFLVFISGMVAMFSLQLHGQASASTSVEPAAPVVDAVPGEPEAVSTPPKADGAAKATADASGGTVVAKEEPVPTAVAPKKSEVVPVSSNDGFYEKFIQDRLRIGTRFLWYSLTDKESGEEFNGSFIGSLNRTTEDQNPAPIYFYAEYAITPYFGFGMSYDQFKVVTLDSGGGDGTFDLDGPILYGFGRYENGSAFTPFLELGLAFYGVNFDAKPEWTFGPGGNVENRFDAKNSTGFVIGGGLDIEIIKHLSVNLYLRYVSVDIDVDYYFTPDPQTERVTQGTFPGDHFAYGLGIAYTF